MGKYILLTTQLVVIVAFLFRFKLDRDLDVLNENIAQKQEAVIAYQDLEHQARIVQDQLETLKAINQNQLVFGNTLGILAQITPLEVEFENISLSQRSISLEGTSLSEAGLATLLNGLRNRPEFNQINLNSVSSGGAKNPILTFTISLKPFLDQTGKK